MFPAIMKIFSTALFESILAPDFLCINILSLHPLRLTPNVGDSHTQGEGGDIGP